MDTVPLTMVPLSPGDDPSARGSKAASPPSLPAARPADGLSAVGPRNGFRFHDQAGPVHPAGIGRADDAGGGDGAEESGAGSRTAEGGEVATAVAGTAGAGPLPAPISR